MEMETKPNISNLIPTIVESLRSNRHDVGFNTYDEGKMIPNYLLYENDNWCIEVLYDCCLDWNYETDNLEKVWGEVTDIVATYIDEETGETGEEFKYNLDELNEMWNALDSELENIDYIFR